MATRKLQTSQIDGARNIFNIVEVYSSAFQQANRDTAILIARYVHSLGDRAAYYSPVIYRLLYAKVLTPCHGGERIARVPSDRPTPKSSVFARGSGHATAHSERLLPSTPLSAAKHGVAACAGTAGRPAPSCPWPAPPTMGCSVS